MKKIILLLSLIALASCGKTNKVNTGATTSTSGTSTYSVPTNAAITDFEGTYDIIRMQSNDCGASIQLVRDCDGLKLLSNNNMGAEEFCNINRGERRNQRDNFLSTTVTLEGNVLRAVTTLRSMPGPGERQDPRDSQVNFTNTLTLNSDGTLTKISHLKSRESRCLYQKR
jgi:hypothetical protein